jgi:hypothetical protein
MSEQQPESDYATVTVTDEDLPEDLQPGDDNPLAEPLDDEAERQDLGDPETPVLERDSEEGLQLAHEAHDTGHDTGD